MRYIQIIETQTGDTEMTRFTEDNTEGFTQQELSEMNRALDILAAEGHADDENHISDFINNAYPQNDAEAYVAAYKAAYAPK
jgi:hypothetical protein